MLEASRRVQIVGIEPCHNLAAGRANSRVYCRRLASFVRSMVGRPLVVFGDGQQTRDFTYVTDTARGIVSAGLSDRTVGTSINLGSGSEIRICDLARAVADV